MNTSPVADTATMANNELRPFEIEVFYDGGCPLCVREMSWLRRWDQSHHIKFTDIDDPHFNAADYGKSVMELMAQMHGRLPDGSWIRGVEVFRRLYDAVGYRRLVFFSRLPLVSQLLDVGYWLFAKNRLWLTGRCAGSSCSISRPAGRITPVAGEELAESKPLLLRK